jgi:hypothetical protein
MTARLKRPVPERKYHHFDELRPATIPSTIAQGSAIKAASVGLFSTQRDE